MSERPSWPGVSAQWAAWVEEQAKVALERLRLRQLEATPETKPPVLAERNPALPVYKP